MSRFVRAAQSLEYIRVQVSATDEDGEAVDPTSDPVALAFVPAGTPMDEDTSFIAGTWEVNDTDASNRLYYARLLVGPTGAYEPTAGAVMNVWVSITDNPEAPKIRAGAVTFV
jgi:hypothetical protein